MTKSTKILGSLLVTTAATAGLIAWLNSEAGKSTKEKIMKYYHDYLEKLRHLSKKNLASPIREAALKFAEAKQLSEESLDDIVIETEKLWKRLLAEA